MQVRIGIGFLVQGVENRLAFHFLFLYSDFYDPMRFLFRTVTPVDLSRLGQLHLFFNPFFQRSWHTFLLFSKISQFGDKEKTAYLEGCKDFGRPKIFTLRHMKGMVQVLSVR
jgi:hypothetical protein